jgi:Fic family protein
MHILRDTYLGKYRESLIDFQGILSRFIESSRELDFSYLTESSSVYSSNIEGNTLDLNSFQNARLTRNQTKDVEEIENLITAYQYAQASDLSEENFLHTHALASKTLLIEALRGTYRNDTVGVFGKAGLIYLAIEAEYVWEKMRDVFTDITTLSEKDLSIEEVFYYAALIHLIFVHIHPFADGNGRSARLLEKWFIVWHLGKDYWKLPSEYYYKENRSIYYNNINLWVNYYEIDYEKSLPFLLMLSESLKI